MKQFCICIPVYSKDLDDVEKISLKRLWKQIGYKDYDVYLVCPKDLDIKNYLNIYPSIKDIRFDEAWFKNTHMYSQLLMTSAFYNVFSDYQYLYIYQLDCYMFYDNLKYWCDQRYDYIGGPVFSQTSGWHHKVDKNNMIIPKIGNGGFSLRRISTFKDICNWASKKYGKSIALYGVEDIFFCDVIKDYDILMPGWKEACKFSWDMNPDVIYDLFNIKNFPMCAHAIGKNIRFYKYFIEELQDQNIVNYCENKFAPFFRIYYIDQYRTTLTIDDLKIDN